MRTYICARAIYVRKSQGMPAGVDVYTSSGRRCLHLQDQEFRCCLRYWLGVPLHSAPYSCPECSGTADEYGDHQVGCGGNGDRIFRHNAVRDVIFSVAQSAALAPTREASGVVPDSQSRPADILLPTWSRGRPAALDVHIISPLQRKTVQEAAHTPGHALQVGIQRKLTAHLSACRAVGVEFVPIVAKTLGGLAEDSIATVRALGKAIAQRTDPENYPSCTRQLYHRLGIALWRGNARLLLHRQPSLPPLSGRCYLIVIPYCNYVYHYVLGSLV